MRVTRQSSWRNNPRTHLQPLGDGPWLRDTGLSDLWRTLLAWGLAAVLVPYGLIVGTKAIGWEPTFWLLFPLIGGLMLIVLALFLGLVRGVLPDHTQICPQCLEGMMRTATRCPQCHFTPSRSDG